MEYLLGMSTSTNKFALKPRSYIIAPSNIPMGICARYSFSHSWGSVIPFVNFQEFSSWYNSISWLDVYLNQGFRELSEFPPFKTLECTTSLVCNKKNVLIITWFHECLIPNQGFQNLLTNNLGLIWDWKFVKPCREPLKLHT